MTIRPLFAAAALALAAFAAPALSTDANALPIGGKMDAPSLTENVACRTVTTRVRGPNGHMRVRTVRQCGVPAWRTERWRARHYDRRDHRRGEGGVSVRIR